MAVRKDRGPINQAVKTDMKNSVLCWLATVDPAGVPNVTPKEIFTNHGDDRILIADIASSNSVRNIRLQPNVCVSFIDIFRQRGFKIVGKAKIIPPEAEDFVTLGAELLRMAGEDFLIRNVIFGRDRPDFEDMGSKLHAVPGSHGRRAHAKCLCSLWCALRTLRATG